MTTNPDPTRWAVKGTSVQAANAIHQAAMALNPKDSWASSSRAVVPRSTSVEYEKETQSTSTRRLNAPPPRNGPPPSRSTGAASRLASLTPVAPYLAQDDIIRIALEHGVDMIHPG
jgi:hypothetical protein